MSDPWHPDFGKQVRVERRGTEVRLTFTADDDEKAMALAEHLVTQLETGHLMITLMGRVEKTVIDEEQG